MAVYPLFDPLRVMIGRRGSLPHDKSKPGAQPEHPEKYH